MRSRGRDAGRKPEPPQPTPLRPARRRRRTAACEGWLSPWRRSSGRHRQLALHRWVLFAAAADVAVELVCPGRRGCLEAEDLAAFGPDLEVDFERVDRELVPAATVAVHRRVHACEL